MQDAYTIFDHRHRFAAWAAARAYSRGAPGHTVKNAARLIDLSGAASVRTANDLPSPEKMSSFLDSLFTRAMEGAQGLTYVRERKDRDTGKKLKSTETLCCSYGRAQKLINIYLKSKLVCAGQETHPSVALLHPPIDSVLINNMKALLSAEPSRYPKALVAFKRAQKLGVAWSDFDKATYESYIDVVKLIQGARPLWGIEWLWDAS
ncbi:hypothetical protein ACVW0Y_003781 [Pseudomonas sp. TE3786]